MPHPYLCGPFIRMKLRFLEVHRKFTVIQEDLMTTGFNLLCPRRHHYLPGSPYTSSTWNKGAWETDLSMATGSTTSQNYNKEFFSIMESCCNNVCFSVAPGSKPNMWLQMLLTILQHKGQCPITNNYLSQNVSSAQGEKCWPNHLTRNWPIFLKEDYPDDLKYKSEWPGRWHNR